MIDRFLDLSSLTFVKMNAGCPGLQPTLSIFLAPQAKVQPHLCATAGKQPTYAQILPILVCAVVQRLPTAAQGGVILCVYPKTYP